MATGTASGLGGALVLGVCSVFLGGCFGTEIPPQKPAENPLANLDKEASKPVDPGAGSTRAQKTDAEGNKVAIDRAVRQSVECGKIHTEGPHGEIVVRMTLGSNGKISNVVIPSSHDDKPIGKCIRQAFEHEVIPTWQGADATGEAKVTLKKGALLKE